MTWLIVILCIVLFIICLFLIPVKLSVKYTDDIKVSLYVLFFKKTLYPEKQKKPNKNDFSLKKLRKKKKELEQKEPEQKKEEKEKPKKTIKEKTKDLKDIISTVKDILQAIIADFGKYLVIKVTKIHIVCATDDAAKTAITYGVVCQAVAYINELLSNVTNFNVKNKKSIMIEADYASEQFKAEIDISFTFKLWQLIAILLKALPPLAKHGIIK